MSNYWFFSYARNEDTQLQFIFESVEVDDEFPFGVKMTYRAFSENIVYEIVESQANDIGFEPIRTIVGTFPESGTWLLRAVPNRTIKPAPFVNGSRNSLEKFLEKFKNDFQFSQPACVAEWEDFASQCPLSDDSQLWESKMYVPFSGVLFSTSLPVAFNRESTIARGSDRMAESFAGNPVRQFQTTASVVHHNRGHPIPPRPPPRLALGDNQTMQYTSLPAVVSNNPRKMKVCDLRVELSKLGLSVKGKRSELRQRLEEAMRCRN